MKKGSKRFLSAALVISLLGGTLAGCGSDSKTVSGSTEDKQDEKTVINVMHCTQNIGQADGDEVKKVEEAINEYIADKIDVKINLSELPGGEYADKCNLALANGEINLLWTASWLGAVSCDSLVQANAVYDISDLLEGSILRDSMPEWAWEASSYNGKDYFVPCYKECAEGYDLMFRKELVDKFGWDLSSVKELKDIEPMLEDCRQDGISAPLLTNSSYMAYKFMMDDYDWVTGSDLLGVDRKTNEVVNVVATDAYRDFVYLMSEWADKGYIQEGDATKSNPSSVWTTPFWGISWWTDVPNNQEASTRYNQEVEVVRMTENWIGSSTTLGSCYAISANSTEEEAKACIDFLGLLYTDITLADLFTFGIEGTDYDRNEDGSVTKKGELYNHSGWESCSVRYLSLESGEPANKVELYEAFNNDSKPSIASGFRFDKTAVEAQLAACSNVQERYGFILENGGYSAAEVDDVLQKFRAALDEAGFQDVLAELTAQYNAWKENK